VSGLDEPIDRGLADRNDGVRADGRRGRAGRNQKRAGARRRLRDWLVDCAPPSV